MSAARIAGCESLLNARGLDGNVDEDAGNFSGGEKLRLALIRELLRETDILLFDEPAAHLDPASRKAFYELVNGLVGRKTIIAVVHSLPEGIDAPVVVLGHGG